MNTSPLLAVIVPVYKVEDYLRECIDSILSQSYTSLRVILVDDGSPDRSGEICEEYARQDLESLSYIRRMVVNLQHVTEGLS